MRSRSEFARSELDANPAPRSRSELGVNSVLEPRSELDVRFRPQVQVGAELVFGGESQV